MTVAPIIPIVSAAAAILIMMLLLCRGKEGVLCGRLTATARPTAGQTGHVVSAQMPLARSVEGQRRDRKKLLQ
jgi:hypothetical protein